VTIGAPMAFTAALKILN